MKANEAPEKIYLYPSDRAGEVYEYEWYDKPWGEGCVEYTRTDAFIEKVNEWIKHNNENGGCSFDGWRKDLVKFLESEL